MTVSSLALQALDLTGAAVLVLAWIGLIHRRIEPLVATYAAQSAAIGLTAGLVAYLYDAPEIYLLAALTVGVNVLILPAVLRRVIRSLDIGRTIDTYVSVRQSALAGLGLLLVSVLVAGPVAPYAGVPSAGLLSISVAVLLIGFFLVVSRRKAITQVVGLLVMNNGILLAGIALTYGLGILVELGLAANLLILAIVARIFLARMKESFDHVDADALRTLEG